MKYYEEEKVTVDGIPYNIYCHIQESIAPCLMVGAHLHDYIEILYCLEGTFQAHLNDYTHEFQTGDMVIINSQEIHQIEAISRGIGKYIVIRFEPEVIYTMSQNVFELKYILPFTLNNYSHQKVFHRSEIESTFIPELLQEILSEFTDKNYGYELAIKAHICKIFLWVLRYWHKAGVKLDVFYDVDQELFKKFQKVFYYVSENHDKEIKAADMAKLCGMSYSYFSRSFNRLMKTSFNEYLNYVRITAAEKLLISTDMNITEVAMKAGFSTASYFIKQFKHYKNISPKQYKKNFSHE